MIKIHHARLARSVRVIWLLEELGVPYQIEEHAFHPDALQSPDYLRVHPLGLIPAIEDGEVRMFESGAILEYVLERYGDGRLAPPVGSPQRPEYLQWFHFGEATVARYVSDIVRNRFGLPEESRKPDVVEYARARLLRTLDVAEQALAERNFVLGAEFSAADIMFAYPLVMLRIIRELPSDLPNIAAYIGRLKERPAYAKAYS